MFIDQAKIYLKGGRGGNGCVSFRREKYVPKGGPDGGNGGDGGSVILEASSSTSTLNAFRYKQHFHADRGRHGQGKMKNGKHGKDLIVKVPRGTQIFDEDKISLLADLKEAGERFVAAKGGKGGRGNASFTTSTNRAPKYSEEGKEGEEFFLILELKLISDVGIVGYPNTGKSTLITKISSAKPKIADYPFTTLTPHLGVVHIGDFDSFTIADIPGLIEGAHSGHGLGLQFLRHVERTRLLLHLVDISESSGRDPVKDIRVINNELRKYSSALSKKPQIIVASKMDILQKPERLNLLKEYCEKKNINLVAISSITGKGLKNLIRLTHGRLSQILQLEQGKRKTIDTPISKLSLLHKDRKN